MAELAEVKGRCMQGLVREAWCMYWMASSSGEPCSRDGHDNSLELCGHTSPTPPPPPPPHKLNVFIVSAKLHVILQTTVPKGLGKSCSGGMHS